MLWKLSKAFDIGQATLRGFLRGREWPSPPPPTASPAPPNPLRTYFDAHRDGFGIWKWNHYFDIYHRHFQPFVGREVHVLEIGIYSGGSLGMWKHYFGSRCHVYGVDIEDACKAYESSGVSVFIGDQQDRTFWKRFRREVPTLDIVIDDGGHLFEQQVVTIEELLPHLRPGGVYLCEDVHGALNRFSSYVSGLALNLNTVNGGTSDEAPERSLVSEATPFQSGIDSVHLYPFVVVIQKRDTPEAEFVAPKRGTQWQPFFD